jgi:hypothetical protein
MITRIRKMTLAAGLVLASGLLLAPAASASTASSPHPPRLPAYLSHEASPVAGGSAAPKDADEVILTNRDGRQEDFWVGTSNTVQIPGALWHAWQDSNGNWTGGPASLGGRVTTGIDGERNADGRLEIFGRGTDNALWHIWQLSPGGSWSGWASLGGVLASGPFTSLTSYGGIIVDVFGPDNIWHRKYQTSPNCCWSGWVFTP